MNSRQNNDIIKNVALIVVRSIDDIDYGDALKNDEYDYQIYFQHFEKHENILSQISFDKLPRINLSIEDFNIKWLQQIQWSTTRADLMMEQRKFEHCPMVNEPFNPFDADWDEKHHNDNLLALRTCALRGLYDELKILPSNIANNNEWNDDIEINLDKCPLYEWWNWLTPTSIGRSPRYDTLYYLIILNQNDFKSSSISSSENNWINIEQIIQSESMLLPPNDLYELKCLSKFKKLNDLKYFMSTKSLELPIERWIPYNEFYQDGTISYLPGDCFYPKNVSIIPKSPPFYNTTIKMSEKRSPTMMNRIEHYGMKYKIIISNDLIENNDGHYHITSFANNNSDYKSKL